jgi:hypothetical protein
MILALTRMQVLAEKRAEPSEPIAVLVALSSRLYVNTVSDEKSAENLP